MPKPRRGVLLDARGVVPRACCAAAGAIGLSAARDAACCDGVRSSFDGLSSSMASSAGGTATPGARHAPLIAAVSASTPPSAPRLPAAAGTLGVAALASVRSLAAASLGTAAAGSEVVFTTRRDAAPERPSRLSDVPLEALSDDVPLPTLPIETRPVCSPDESMLARPPPPMLQRPPPSPSPSMLALRPLISDAPQGAGAGAGAGAAAGSVPLSSARAAIDAPSSGGGDMRAGLSAIGARRAASFLGVRATAAICDATCAKAGADALVSTQLLAGAARGAGVTHRRSRGHGGSVLRRIGNLISLQRELVHLVKEVPALRQVSLGQAGSWAFERRRVGGPHLSCL